MEGKFTVERIEDKVVDKAGEEELQEVRTVVLAGGDGMKVTLKGARQDLDAFNAGETVGLKLAHAFEEVE